MSLENLSKWHHDRNDVSRVDLSLSNRVWVRHACRLFVKELPPCGSYSVSSIAAISRFDAIVIILSKARLICREAILKIRTADLPDS